MSLPADYESLSTTRTYLEKARWIKSLESPESRRLGKMAWYSRAMDLNLEILVPDE